MDTCEFCGKGTQRYVVWYGLHFVCRKCEAKLRQLADRNLSEVEVCDQLEAMKAH